MPSLVSNRAERVIKRAGEVSWGEPKGERGGKEKSG